MTYQELYQMGWGHARDGKKEPILTTPAYMDSWNDYKNSIK